MARKPWMHNSFCWKFYGIKSETCSSIGNPSHRSMFFSCEHPTNVHMCLQAEFWGANPSQDSFHEKISHDINFPIQSYKVDKSSDIYLESPHTTKTDSCSLDKTVATFRAACQQARCRENIWYKLNIKEVLLYSCSIVYIFQPLPSHRPSLI